MLSECLMVCGCGWKACSPTGKGFPGDCGLISGDWSGSGLGSKTGEVSGDSNSCGSGASWGEICGEICGDICGDECIEGCTEEGREPICSCQNCCAVAACSTWAARS
mmetsp:Transcript_121030/g.287522  ORF Transcript_121030/g.287522 Transcript_121030/m.287522 type:complete len:107 (+) Transcript_121030:477-797(+)